MPTSHWRLWARRLGVVGLFGLLTSYRSQLLACASCGSGGDDPLILYPWETYKGYAGFALTNGYTPIDSDGTAGKDMAPTSRTTTTVSFGRTITNRSFVTVTAPYIVNKRGDFQRSGWGDPMITGRYTVVQQDITEEWIPQVQVIAATRTGQVTSIYDYQDPAKLDVFGSGIPEWRVGVDVWHGMYDWKGGVAQTMTGPLGTRKTDFGTVRNGTTFRTTVTGGRGWHENAKIIGGINHEQTTKKSYDNVAQDDSDMISNGVFLTGDAMIDHQRMLRLSVARSAAFGANKNTTQSDTVTLAFMQSF